MTRGKGKWKEDKSLTFCKSSQCHTSTQEVGAYYHVY